jgi:hypothetical protein
VVVVSSVSVQLSSSVIEKVVLVLVSVRLLKYLLLLKKQ